MLRDAMGKLFRCTSGSIAVETAIIAPMLILVVASVVDIGRATYDVTSLAGAVRAGSQYALRTPNDIAGIKVAVSAASTLTGDKIDPDAVPFCECPNGTPKPLCDSCGPEVLRRFVRVTASHTFSRIMPFSSIVIPSNLTAQAIVRTQ